MRVGVKNGQLLICRPGPGSEEVIRSWGTMKYDKGSGTWKGPADLEQLERLKKIVPEFPHALERMRKNLELAGSAVERERTRPDPRPLYKYPVKARLYSHQVRAANMALLVFGLIGGEAAK
jgi:hypothetical protein